MGSRDWLKLYKMKFGTLIMDRRFIIQVYKTDRRLARKLTAVITESYLRSKEEHGLNNP